MKHHIFTIGHSQLPAEGFLSLLRMHNVNAVADVRSQPYSSAHPHFNRHPLARILKSQQIAYVFLGLELGGRTSNKSCYIDGKVDYQRLAETPEFKIGISRLLKGIQRFRVALLCAEKDPLHCHRSILIGRRLHEQGACVRHILEGGNLEEHDQTIERLLEVLNLSGPHMFRDKEGLISLAYQMQGEKIAFAIEQDTNGQKSLSKVQA